MKTMFHTAILVICVAIGAIKVLLIGVREYSTATDLDLVTRLATNPAVSRLRNVLVRMR